MQLNWGQDTDVANIRENGVLISNTIHFLVTKVMQHKIMYIELKLDGLRGKGRVGRVGMSKTGKTLYYGDRTLEQAKGVPLKANYFDAETNEDFWVSGPRKDGSDSLFAGVVKIDEDVREEYWTNIRKQPKNLANSTYKSPGKSKPEREALEKGLRRRQMDSGWMPK